MTHKTVQVQGQNFTLVNRDLMRRRTHGRYLSVPWFLRGLAYTLPTPPAYFDGSKSRSITYPVLGNRSYGDCYLADACHCIQTWTGNVGQEATFDEQAVIQLYLQLSGGDNGLDDATIFRAWRSGIFGHKILDDMTVDPRDDNAIRLGITKFWGGSYTSSLFDAWLKNPEPGTIWDAPPGQQPNPRNGHAMCLSGFTTKGAPLPFAIPGHARGSPAPFDFYHDETWGFGTPVLLTPSGLKASDPEVTIQFSLDMFNAQGVAPDGETYDQKASLWKQLGGMTMPPSPFTGGPPPTVETLFPMHVSRLIRKGSPVYFLAKTDIPVGDYNWDKASSVHVPSAVFPDRVDL